MSFCGLDRFFHEQNINLTRTLKLILTKIKDLSEAKFKNRRYFIYYLRSSNNNVLLSSILIVVH